MSRRREKLDNRQISIFDYLRELERQTAEKAPEGQFACAERLRSAMRGAIKKSPLSVHQIAGEMSHACDTSITAEQIYSWTRRPESGPARYVPAEYLPAFCHATESNAPLVVMGRLVGLFVMPGPEALRAEIQKLDERKRQTAAEIRRRRALLSEMESRGAER